MVIVFINDWCIFWMRFRVGSISKRDKIKIKVRNWQFGIWCQIFFRIVM